MNISKSESNSDPSNRYIAASGNVFVQRSLAIGAVNDPLEHEADSVADKVMRMPESSVIQRKCPSCEEEDKVQRKPLASFIQKMGGDSGTKASDSVSGKINSTRGSGSNLDSGTKSFMESRFGTDFSGVKIHTGDYAVQMSQELNAQAFTVGNDVYFNSGKYNPETDSGKYLLAHELTHTVQQVGVQRKHLIQRDPEPVKTPAKTLLTSSEVKTYIEANNKSTVSTELLLCLIWKESGFNPNIKSSSSSATGLMQMTTGAVEQVNKSTPKGVHFEHSEMTDPAKNIECGTYYLQIRIDWAKGDVKKGLEGYGTGAGYADNIKTCETCIKGTPADTDSCLNAIHK